MDKSKIDFNNITNLNYSNRNQYHQPNEENYINDNILIFGENDSENDKKEAKRNNRIEFEKILNKTRLKFSSLSEKIPQIINNKDFSFKNFLPNYLGIQSIIPLESKNITSSIINNLGNSSNNIINLNRSDMNMNVNSFNFNNNSSNNINNNALNLKNKNYFKIIEPLNDNISSENNILPKNSGEIDAQKLIGKKRKLQNINNNIDKIEEEKKILFNEILTNCQEISNLKKDIIRIEEQNNLQLDNDNIETTLILNNKPIANFYLNNNIFNKIYIFKNNKNVIKENEILSHLKQIKKNLNSVLNKIKKK